MQCKKCFRFLEYLLQKCLAEKVQSKKFKRQVQLRRKSEAGVPVESFIFPHIWALRQDSQPAFCSGSDLWVRLWETEWMHWTVSEVHSIIIQYDSYTVIYDWLTFTDGIIHQTLNCIFRYNLLVWCWCWFSKVKCNLSYCDLMSIITSTVISSKLEIHIFFIF